MNRLAAILPAGNVLVNVEATSKKRAFEHAGLLFENLHSIARATITDNLFARERLDRVRHHDRGIVRGAERLRLRARGAYELGRDERRHRNAVVLEEHAVVHTARRARPSISKRFDDEVALLQYAAA